MRNISPKVYLWKNKVRGTYKFTDREITSVAGTVGHIPCVVDTFQDVAMILWFKDSSGTPIYR